MDDLSLQAFLEQRDIPHDAAGILAGVNQSTITRICAGQVRARPKTIVALARALGVSAKRMQRMCDVRYLAAHPDEDARAVTAARKAVTA